MSTLTGPSAGRHVDLLDAAAGREAQVAGLDEPLADEEAGVDAHAVAAHLGDRAVGVAVVHEPLRLVGPAAAVGLERRRDDAQHAVAAEPGPAVAEPADERRASASSRPSGSGSTTKSFSVP